MKKLIVLTAFAFGVGVTHQALACDFQREATQAPVVVADNASCSGANCAAAPAPDSAKAACEGNGCTAEVTAPAPTTSAPE
jgi:hypothetical protein